jgi:GT2 family glycosyltransferase
MDASSKIGVATAPVVSICIPAHSRPRELREAVASVLAQTVSDLEVVVTDDSGRWQDLEREFSDNRLRYVLNPARLGMAGNWQQSLSLARGRFIGLLMDDDILLPTFVERCLSVFAADRTVGVVFTNHFFADGRSVVARDSLLPGGTYTQFLPLLIRHKPVAICATLMRRAVWDDVLPVPDMHTADLAMHMRAAQSGHVFHYIDDPLMVYRVHGGQLSGDARFRHHDLALWRAFRFEDGSEQEALRRQRLAEALLSSAASRMQTGEVALAAELAREASCLGVPANLLTARARVVAVLARSRVAAFAAGQTFRISRRARALALRAARKRNSDSP